MEQHEYSKMVKALGAFFQAKDKFKDVELNRLYLRELRHIPGDEETLSKIHSYIAANWNYLPRNVPKAVIEAYNSIKATYGRETEQRGHDRASGDGCSQCIGGWINFTLQRAGEVAYEYTATCGHCNSVMMEKVSSITLDRVARMGGRLVHAMPQNMRKGGQHHPTSRQSVSEMAENTMETVH